MHAASQSATGHTRSPFLVWQTVRMALLAAPTLAIVLVLHAGLLLYLASVRFPALWLRRHAGPMGPSMVCSGVVHAALIIVMALWALEVVAPPIELGGWLQAVEDTADAGPELDIPVLATVTESHDIREASSSASAAQVATVGAQVLGRHGPEYTDPDLLLSSAPAGGARVGGGGIAGLAAGDSQYGGFGKTLGRELGAEEVAKKGKANFFGISASGNSFVFVVDKSGSMAGSRFRRARNELRRSIEALEDRQTYYIIFYDVAAVPMPANGLVAASPRNNRDTFRWLTKVEPFGNTNPLPAMIQALTIKPDAIFLLTDGDFPKVMADNIVSFQGTGIPIHTIGFENAAGEMVLNSISARTGGTYRFVK